MPVDSIDILTKRAHMQRTGFCGVKNQFYQKQKKK